MNWPPSPFDGLIIVCLLWCDMLFGRQNEMPSQSPRPKCPDNLKKSVGQLKICPSGWQIWANLACPIRYIFYEALRCAAFSGPSSTWSYFAATTPAIL